MKQNTFTMRNAQKSIRNLRITTLIVLLFFAQQTIKAQCTAPCLTDILQLGTGYNHATGVVYTHDSKDEYWRIVSAATSENLTNPICAISGIDIWDNWPQPILSPLTINNTKIGIRGQASNYNAAGNKTNSSGTCNLLSGEDYYTFERDFEICSDTNIELVHFYFLYTGDLVVKEVILLGSAISPIILDGTCVLNGNTGIIDQTQLLPPGKYTIRVNVLNDWDNYPFIGSPNGNTPMGLQLGGFVNELFGKPIFVDNLHFGKNVYSATNLGYCAPPYPPSPLFSLFGDHCVDSLNPLLSTVNDTISPYYPSSPGVNGNTYIIAGPTIPTITSSTDINGLPIGIFTVGIGTYTITSTDAVGCSFSKILKVTQIPSLTVSPTDTCIAPGSYALIGVHVTPGLWSDFGFSIDTMAYVELIDSFVNLTQGFHTIVVIDSNGCTSDSVHMKIGNTFSLAMTATPPCVSPTGASVLNTITIPWFVGPKTFAYDAGVFQTLSNFTATGPGIHTVICKDQYDCLAYDTIEVHAIPTPGLSVNALPGCISTNPFSSGSTVITATPTIIGAYQYQIKLPGSSVWSAPQISNNFTVNIVGKYEIRIIDGNGCASASETLYVGDCMHCHSEIPPPEAKWYIDAVSSTVFPTGVTPTSPIVIDGTLYVDNNLNIWNNPNVYFTYSSKIIMNNTVVPTELYIENSTLKPCFWWWQGVFAENDKQKVKVNNSIAKYMAYSTSLPNSSIPSTCGFIANNGAIIEATNSHFENNMISILIAHANGIYPGKVENNVFHNYDIAHGANWGYYGVGLADVENAIIGAPTTNLPDIKKGNSFEGLNCGIAIYSGKENISGSPLNSNIKLYNNYFKNIKSSFIPSSTTFRDKKVLDYTYDVWTYATGFLSGWGSAIVANAGKGFIGNTQFWPNLTVEVKNFTTSYDDSYDFFPGIYDCDRGIISGNTNMIIDKILIKNTLLANMNTTVRFKSYQISNNFIQNSHYGIQLNGAIASSIISSNNITTRNQAIDFLYQTSPTTTSPGYFSPVGIDITHTAQYPSTIVNHYLDNNVVNMPFSTGQGIITASANAFQYVGKNEVNFLTTSTSPSVGLGIKSWYGLVFQQCKATIIDQNFITGSANLGVFNARNSMGVYMDNSPKCLINCNRAKFTRYGFYAWGNNATGPTNVTHNKFSGNRYPWYFLDAGATVPASFGTQGFGSVDNGNSFLGSVNRLNSNGFKVFRNSTIPTSDQIRTVPGLLTSTESGSSLAGAEYLVANPPLTYTDPCPNPLFITGEGENGEGDEDIEVLEDIIEDSINYIGHEEVGEWIDECIAYQALEEDSTLRYSNLEMQAFYNSRYGTLIGRIYEADKAINLLIDSTTNASNYEFRYLSAVQANNLIVNGEEWEMNEHDLNAIQLKLISESEIDTIGYDTMYLDSLMQIVLPRIQYISQTEKDFLRDLANSCPFVAGTCVYKARSLWKRFNPSEFYDDRILCLESNNKNSDLTNVDIDSLYESQIEKGIVSKPIINTHRLKDGEVLIYPNPANSTITIEYTCATKGNFELTNSLGQLVLNTELGEGRMKVQLSINGLTSGMYYYKCSFEGCEDAYGKLIIE